MASIHRVGQPTKAAGAGANRARALPPSRPRATAVGTVDPPPPAEYQGEESGLMDRTPGTIEQAGNRVDQAIAQVYGMTDVVRAKADQQFGSNKDDANAPETPVPSGTANQLHAKLHGLENALVALYEQIQRLSPL